MMSKKIAIVFYSILYILVSGCGNEMNMALQYEDGYSIDDFTSNLKNGKYKAERKRDENFRQELSDLSLGISRGNIVERFGRPDVVVNFESRVGDRVIETVAVTYFVDWCDQCGDSQENSLFIFYIDERDQLITVLGVGGYSRFTKGHYPRERGTYWSIK